MGLKLWSDWDSLAHIKSKKFYTKIQIQHMQAANDISSTTLLNT